MGALADIFAAVRLQLDGTGFEAQATALATKSGQNAGQQMSNQFNAKLKSSVLQGVGLGAGIGGFNLLSTGISKTIGFLGDVVQAGIAEEASISKLGASLKANIPGWDGNTAAIEKNMAAGIALGFSDEEQRASLAFLVAATHNVTEAQQIQTVAMDLARFKGISLMDATDALTKVEAGSYRILKSLGIELKAGATAQEAMTAVERVANGQALEYTNTLEGKLLVAQTKVSEKMDELGSKSLPLVAAGLDDLTSLATNTEKELNAIGDAAGYAAYAHQAFAASLGTDVLTFDQWKASVAAAATDTSRLKDDLVTQAAAASTDATVFTGKLIPSVESLAKASKDAAGEISLLTEAIFGPAVRKGEMAQMKQDLADLIAAGPGSKNAADVAIYNGKLADLRKQLADLVKAGPDSKSSGDMAIYAGKVADLKKQISALVNAGPNSKSNADIAIYNGKVAELSQKIMAMGEAIAEDQGPKSLAAWFAAQTKALNPANDAAREYLATMRAIADMGGLLPATGTGGGSARGKGFSSGGQATGGSYSAGMPYIVGEKGPELRVSTLPGYTLTHQEAMAIAGGSGAGQTINIANVSIADAHDEFSLVQSLKFLASVTA